MELLREPARRREQRGRGRPGVAPEKDLIPPMYYFGAQGKSRVRIPDGYLFFPMLEFLLFCPSPSSRLRAANRHSLKALGGEGSAVLSAVSGRLAGSRDESRPADAPEGTAPC